MAAALGLFGCVGGDVTYDVGPVDAAVGHRDFTVLTGPPPDLTVLPDLYGFLVPADAYAPGTPRLSLGIFYDGGFSELIAIDNSTANFYVYSGTLGTIDSDRSDKAEGYFSSVLKVAGGLGWFGCGVQWTAAHDLSAYKALHLALKSQSASMADVSIGMNSPTMASQTTKLSARNYGYKNDGAWHTLTIPLADFAKAAPSTFDPKRIGAPLIITNAAAVQNGDVVRIDDVYLE